MCKFGNELAFCRVDSICKYDLVLWNDAVVTKYANVSFSSEIQYKID